MVMNLAARAREIFESSEVDEKRELLNLVFQNLKLEGKKWLTEVREPFHAMLDIRTVQPIGGGENRTLVLSKLHIDHYMLSVLKLVDSNAERANRTNLP